MRQIADPRAPFASIDEALDVAQAYLDAEIRQGGTPIGLVAEPQAGGYFARISWRVPTRGGRGKSNRRETVTAEIGRIDRREA